MVQKVFNRNEKKFFLNPEAYIKMREMLLPYMEEDSYGLHTIRNIYYDTKCDELIRTSIERPKYKEKFRVRCYGQPEENTEVFLEIKKKYKGLVNKRRIVLPRMEAQAYLKEGKRPNQESQILKEIDYFLKHYEVEPKVYLAYDRIALYGKEDNEFRITFDTNIRSRNTNLDIGNDEAVTEVLAKGYYLMEVKITNSMPLWFVDILSELKLYTTSFSKYGTVYKCNLKNGYYDYVNTQMRTEGEKEDAYDSMDKRRIYAC